MSSAKFGVNLRPDPVLRRLVLLTGAAALIAGCALICGFRLPLALRVALVAVWIANGLWELHRQVRGSQRVRSIRLDAAGDVTVISPDGRTAKSALTTGTIVSTGVAWLRILQPDGSHHGELLLRGRTENQTWHRLQLIWQQRREGFGHRGRA